MAKFAVHSFFAPAAEINDQGFMSLDGKHYFHVPEPLHVAETFKAAEAWRKDNLPSHYVPRSTQTIGQDRNS